MNVSRNGQNRACFHVAHGTRLRHKRTRRDPATMASKVAGQFAHMKNVAAEFVRAKPNRACPPRRVFRLDGSMLFPIDSHRLTIDRVTSIA